MTQKQYSQELRDTLKKTMTRPAYLISTETSGGTIYRTTAGTPIPHEDNLYTPGQFKVTKLIVAGGGYEAALEYVIPSYEVSTFTLLKDIDKGIMRVKLHIIYDEDTTKTVELFRGYVTSAGSLSHDIRLSASSSHFLMTPTDLCNTIWDVAMPAKDQEFHKVGTNFTIT